MRPLAKIGLRILAGLGVLFLLLIALAIRYRLPLAEWALRNALRDAGALPGELKVTDLQLRRATIAPFDANWHGQQLRVESITLDRPDLFSRSLGHVEAKGVRVVLNPVALRATGTMPSAATTKQTGKPQHEAPTVTFDDLSIEGRLALWAPQAAVQSLTFILLAKPNATGDGVQAEIKLAGPELSAEGRGNYDFVRAAAEFELTNARVDLAAGRKLVEQIIALPFKGWEVGGKATITACGRIANGALAGQAVLHLRDGVLRSAGNKISLEGIESDVVLADAAHLATEPAQGLKVREANVGNVVLRDAILHFQLKSPHECCVESAEATVFGGRASVEPFAFDPTVVDYAITLRCDGVRVEEILALFPTAHAKATGLADARLPVHYGSQGFTFDHGWLALKAGTSGTLQIDQPGLLTGNLSPQNVAYPTLKAVETGLLNLHVTELRAEIYPPDAPANRSVQIRIAGEPLDPSIKAPVTFEVNVNGPVEKLIQWGLDSRMKFSGE